MRRRRCISPRRATATPNNATAKYGRVSGVTKGVLSVGDSRWRSSPGLLSTGQEAGRVSAMGMKATGAWRFGIRYACLTVGVFGLYLHPMNGDTEGINVEVLAPQRHSSVACWLEMEYNLRLLQVLSLLESRTLTLTVTLDCVFVLFCILLLSLSLLVINFTVLLINKLITHFDGVGDRSGGRLTRVV